MIDFAKKLTTVAKNTVEIANYQKSIGLSEGAQSEQKRFWEGFQGGGKRFNYVYAFHGMMDLSYTYGWNDENFNPIYPISLGNENKTHINFGRQTFYYNTNITDTKVDILVYVTELKSTFTNAYKLKTIRKLKLMRDDVKFSTPFSNCVALENIVIEGTISKDISFQWSKKLTHESLLNIINALKDNSGTDTWNTITLGEDNIAKLTDDEILMMDQKQWIYS